MSKINYRTWDDEREDRKRQKKLKKRKGVKEAKNKWRKQK